MGKNKKIHKNKNVFKVATVRSIKLKAKAQKVITNLKKFDPKGNKIPSKSKTVSMDQLLRELENFRASNSKIKLDAKKTHKESIKINKEVLKPKMTSAQTDVTASMIEQIQL